MSSCALLQHVFSFPLALTGPMSCGIFRGSVFTLQVSQLALFCLLSDRLSFICTGSSSLESGVVMQHLSVLLGQVIILQTQPVGLLQCTCPIFVLIALMETLPVFFF